MAQMGFFDLSDRYANLGAKKDPLVEIDAAVPWEEFRPVLEQVWRKPMDAALMFKTLALSALYNLSDDQIVYQVRDRLSFMYYPAGHIVVSDHRDTPSFKRQLAPTIQKIGCHAISACHGRDALGAVQRLFNDPQLLGGTSATPTAAIRDELNFRHKHVLRNMLKRPDSGLSVRSKMGPAHPSAAAGAPGKRTAPVTIARNENLRAARHLGRALWRKWSQYHTRSRVEAKMNCLKPFGERIMSRDPDRQTAEIQPCIAIMTRFNALGTAEIEAVA